MWAALPQFPSEPPSSQYLDKQACQLITQMPSVKQIMLLERMAPMHLQTGHKCSHRQMGPKSMSCPVSTAPEVDTTLSIRHLQSTCAGTSSTQAGAFFSFTRGISDPARTDGRRHGMAAQSPFPFRISHFEPNLCFSENIKPIDWHP